MYKVLIADDETIIRVGIKDFVSWSDMGLELIGCARDGDEALEMLRTYDIDILISDIKMPYKTGFDLIECANHLGLHPITILISGYDDFVYAQKAVHFENIVGYILKPINLNLLRKSLYAAIDARKRWLSANGSPDQAVLQQPVSPEPVVQASHGNPLVSSAIKIIGNEYQKKQLTLKMIAESLNVTPNYLGHCFKKETGLSLPQYLCDYRINLAKKLLKNQKYKIYEIADLVGFMNSKHFAALFKKATGLTPKEYRTTHLDD